MFGTDRKYACNAEYRSWQVWRTFTLVTAVPCPPPATSRSKNTESSVTCGRWRSWAPTGRSTGTARRGSTLLPCSARCWTRARAVTSRCGAARSAPAQAAVPARHQHPADPVPGGGGGRRGDRLHGAGDQRQRRGPGTCWSGRRARSAAGPPSSSPAIRRSTTAGRRTTVQHGERGRRGVRPRPLGRCRAADRRCAQGRGVRCRGDLHPGGGRERRHRAGVERRGAPASRGRDGGTVHPDVGFLAGLGQPVQVPGPVAGDGAAFGPGAEAARLPPDWCPGRGAHHVAAGAARAAAATGTTGTAGCATPPSPCTR